LALALRAAAGLFEALCQGPEVSVKQLFEGAEQEAPNIDTRITTLRDLASAARWSIRYMRFHAAETSGEDADEGVRAREVSPLFWESLMREYAESAPERAQKEAGRLLSDLFQACSDIATIICGRAVLAQRDWQEVLREIDHIRMHTDYAEEFVIDVLRGPEDAEQIKGVRTQ